jgi:hypothetical protein
MERIARKKNVACGSPASTLVGLLGESSLRYSSTNSYPPVSRCLFEGSSYVTQKHVWAQQKAGNAYLFWVLCVVRHTPQQWKLRQSRVLTLLTPKAR